MIAVASGKGGVGKSTVSVNLTLALKALGKRVGLLDADVYGPSVPLMMGTEATPRAGDDKKIYPVEKYGVSLISMGFFLDDQSPVIWRGPLVMGLVRQFLRDVEWGELDVLLIDLPPGTGDVSMTLAQLLPQARILIVTTPQPAAQTVAARAAEMAAKVDLELLGAIENMSGFTAPDGQRFTIFGEGGGQTLADELDVPLLGKVPLSEELRAHADAGTPLAIERPDEPAAQAIRDAARGIVAATPQELPVMQVAPAAAGPAPAVSGTELPMAR